ncbi:hypothetical protein FOC4_g10000341, partial [Fusarium odoratissimum]
EIWQRDYDVIPPAWPVDVALHYKRAKLIYRYSDLILHNIEKLTKRFWDFYFDTKPESERAEFLCHIRRVAVRTLSLSIMGISAIRVGTHIAALYSERRTITAPDGHSAMPIIGFSTQQRPIIEGWVQGKVLTAFAY